MTKELMGVRERQASKPASKREQFASNLSQLHGAKDWWLLIQQEQAFTISAASVNTLWLSTANEIYGLENQRAN